MKAKYKDIEVELTIEGLPEERLKHALAQMICNTLYPRPDFKKPFSEEDMDALYKIVKRDERWRRIHTHEIHFE